MISDDNDTSTLSSSSKEEVVYTKRKHKKKLVKSNYSRMSFNYNHIPSNTTTPLLLVSLGTPPQFGKTNYSKWSHSMRDHLYSLHLSIWNVVELGIDMLDSDNENYSQAKVEQIIHHNAQASIVLLSSLKQEEYDKIDELVSTKKIWDTLKVAHEGTRAIHKLKIEVLEGELWRFIMLDDESQQDMYNRLKKIINKLWSLGSKKWSKQCFELFQ